MSRQNQNKENITRIKSPSIPTPAVEYSQTTQELANNTLRNYHAQVDQANADTVLQINSLNTLTWLGTGSF
jgi:hypothetical protein